jgi:hypothetical protein
MTIRTTGCALTVLSMALNRAGVANRPNSLNDVLRRGRPFDAHGGIRWGDAVAALGSSLGIRFVPRGEGHSLCDVLARKSPVIAGVNLDGAKPTHFVLIADPRFAARTLEDYDNHFRLRGYITPRR